jgi:uncharacterized protein (DUF342 family)
MIENIGAILGIGGSAVATIILLFRFLTDKKKMGADVAGQLTSSLMALEKQTNERYQQTSTELAEVKEALHQAQEHIEKLEDLILKMDSKAKLPKRPGKS